MSTAQTYALIAVFAVSACALSGVFLVLRRMAMMADAISHAILPGLVAGYVLARGPSDLWGFVGAACAGVLTVFLVESLTRSRRVREDTAIGVVFPALFALGVLIITRYFSNVHLDTDAILVGDFEWAALQTLRIGDRDYGLQAIWVLGGLTLLNIVFLALFYKELKLSTFDPALAAALGFAPAVLHYALMTLVAVTTIGAFNAVGAIMAVALFIVPPATASLLTHRLPVLIGLSLAVGIAGALGGVHLALLWNVKTGGMIAATLGLLFFLALLFAPQRGLAAQALRHVRQRRQFATEVLLVHLAHHEGTAGEAEESDPAHLERELGWQRDTAQRTIARARSAGLIAPQNGGGLHLTPRGRDLARRVAAR